MTREELDRALAEYLGTSAPELAQAVARVEDKVDALSASVERVVEDRLTDRERLARAVRRVRALEMETERRSAAEPGPNWHADPREITGTFDVRELVADKKRRDSDHKWLRRARTEWIARCVGAVLLLLAATLVSALTARAVTPANAAPAPAHAGAP